MSVRRFLPILKAAVLAAIVTNFGCLGILSLTEKEKDSSVLTMLGLGAAAVVGGGTATPAAGATLSSSDGLFQITIPPGAMSDTQTFIITKYAPTGVKLPGGFYATSPVYDVQPSYAFQKDVDVSIVLDSALVASYGAALNRSRIFMSSATATQNEARVAGWQGQEGSLVDYRLSFKTRTFSTFGGGTPPAGNLAPVIMGAFYYFKPACSYLPYRVRTRVVEPDGDTFTVHLITGPAGGGTNSIPMVAEGGGWFAADIPYAAMVAAGIQMQVLAIDQYGNNSSTPGSSVFQYPADSGNATFIANYNPDRLPAPNGLLDAWEVDHMPGGNTTDTDGDGIPDTHDDTPNGEANPAIDSLSLVIVPNQVWMDVGETVAFSATATKAGAPVFVNPSFVTTGNGLGGGPVGVLSGAVFTASVPGVAGVTATVGAQNAVASITVRDTVGPNNITDLAAAALTHTQIRLNWTAPGNDGSAGKAASYEVRRSGASIASDAACSAAAPMAQVMVPKTGGLSETLDISGLSPGTTYHFCVRAFDSSGNRNSWTGSVQAATGPMPDMTPPADIAGVTATATAPDKVQLNWTAVGDDGNSGSAQSYEIRRSTSPINNNTQCDAGANVPNTVSPAAAGSPLGFTVTGLSENTVYYFCVRAFDGANNRSNWSGLATATTLEGNDPPVADAGPDQNLALGIGQSIAFNGTGSYDPDAVYCGANTGNYIYVWTLASKPPTSALTSGSIVGANTLTPTIVPDVAGLYTFQFAFTDDPGACGGGARLNVDTVQVTVAFDSTPPTVSIGNLRNNSVVETGFVIGTAVDAGTGPASVEVSLDGGGYAAATLNAGAWKFKLPTGASTWRDGSQNTSSASSVTVRKGINKDINGDGYADVVVGAAYFSNNTGRVYIFHSAGSSGVTITAAASASQIIDGDQNNGYFGVAVVTGDVNGDGYADVVASAPFHSANEGRVYVFHSTGSAGISSTNVASASTAIAHSVTGFFGTSLATGDVNGDGYADVVAGASGYSSSTGRVYVMHSAGSAGLTITDATSASTIIGSEGAANDGLGYSVATGDLNGDGYADVVAGAYGYSSATGRVYIFHSSGSSGVTITAAVSASLAITGEASSRFGSSIATGDLNGDGNADVVIGAWQYSSSTGRVYSFHSTGSSGVTATNATSASNIITGEGAGNQFYSVATGDVNGDGYADIVVGALQYGTYTGRAYAFHSGGTTGVTITAAASASRVITGEGTNNYLGYRIATGDVNGDGYADVIAGAYGASAGGRAYVFHSTGNSGVSITAAGSASTVIVGGAGTFFGFSVALNGEWGDSGGELAGGIASEPNPRAGPPRTCGRSFVHSLRPSWLSQFDLLVGGLSPEPEPVPAAIVATRSWAWLSVGGT